MMRRTAWRRVGSALAAAMVLLAAGCAQTKSTGSESGGASFEGETVHFVVSFSPGGGYDTLARAMKPYLEDELGATVVVENEDGAGGLVAANGIFAAEPDGTTIGFFAGQGIAGAEIGGSQGVNFSIKDFSYVSRVSAESRVLVTGTNSEYQTFDDVLAAQDLKYATAGTGAADNLDATALVPALGLDAKIVSGYEGSSETSLAISSGEVDLGSGTVSSRLEDIKAGEMRPLLIIGDESVPALPDVPVLTDQDLNEQGMELATAHLDLQDMGRMVWAPPGVPEDRLQTLEAAFEAVLADPEFVKKMEQADEDIEFTSGADAKAVAEQVLAAPDHYKELLEQAFENQ